MEVSAMLYVVLYIYVCVFERENPEMDDIVSKKSGCKVKKIWIS